MHELQDGEKKRYFKIMPNRAVPQSHQYTAGAMKEKSEREAREKADKALREKERAEFDPRRPYAPMYTAPSLPILLTTRGLGLSFRPGSQQVFGRKSRQTMVKYLRHRSTIPNAGGQDTGIGFTMNSAPIRDFQLHPFLNEAVVGRSDGTVRVLRFDAKDENGVGRYMQTDSCLISHEDSEVNNDVQVPYK
ncbi:hypothetical protein HK097_010656 [Rhizophlyctis rosea]|uniref:Uncharacterized protein n=1 Tax=Rhizophlyctis rosea TaxID=64517 RepID=A0AAD5S8X4_9FUNG|nr:hypothetical protein HK097_010656 [Rhizophlyctis rosea]